MMSTYPAWGLKLDKHWRWVEYEGEDYQVNYKVCPPEPDVGINSHYIEILEVTPDVDTDVRDELADKLWDVEYDDRGNEP